MDVVLVVDDDPAIRRMISLALTAAGLNVLTAGDGAEALDLIRESEPTVVVLDLQMPGLDGWQVFKEMESWPSRPPVLICSAFSAERYRRELGAEDSLAKPFHPDELVSKVKALQVKQES